MNRFSPSNFHLELLDTEDGESHNPVYGFLKDCRRPRPDRPGEIFVYPKGRTTDGGSIPKALQGFVRPMDTVCRAAFIDHDFKYKTQGGRRFWTGRPECTLSYNVHPISRARADWELFADMVCAEAVFRWEVLYANPSLLRALWLPVVLTLRTMRAGAIYALVAAFGWLSWRSEDTGTEPYAVKATK